MPNSTFDARFLQSSHTIAAVNQQQLSAFYNEAAPIYFEATDDPDTNAQLQAFKASPSYEPFQQQYQYLLTCISEWCVANNVPLKEVWSDDNEPKRLSAFQLLDTRMFGPVDFFSTRATILFSEGKQSLEELYILLNDERIPFDSKKNVLMNFQQGMVVCGDGSLTNIVDAKDDLKAAIGLDATIAAAKKKLIQQEILHFIQLKHFHIRPGNEIHLVNAFYDVVAESYGMSKRNDNVKIPGAEKYSDQLVAHLNAQLTPQIVIRLLTEQIHLDVLTIQANLFKGRESVDWSASFINEAEKLINSFNDRYSPLITIDIHSIIQSDEDALVLAPKPINETALQVTVIKQFHTLFCKQNMLSNVITLADGPRSLNYIESFIWIEEGSEITSCTPQQFFASYLQAKTPFKREQPSWRPNIAPQGLMLLNQLWTYYPTYKNELLQCLYEPNVDVAYLLSGSNVELIEAILHNQLQPQNKFSFVVDMNVVRLLNRTERFDLLKQLSQCGIIDTYTLVLNKEYALLDSLLQHEVLSPAHFERHYHITSSLKIYETIYLLASRNQFDLIGKLSDKGLISQEMLRYTSNNITTSVLTTLYVQKKMDLIKQLFRNGSLTTLQLATDNKWEILSSLLAENAINLEHLSYRAESGTHFQQNTIFILVINNQKDLLLSLLNRQLLIPEQFVAKAGSGVYKGRTALDLLLQKGEFDLIKSLLEQKVINILTIAEHKEFSTLDKLIDLQVLSRDDLSEEVRTAKTTKSTLKFIVRHQRYDLLQKLADQGVLIEAHLSLQLAPGKNLAQLLHENQQQGLLQQLNSAAEIREAPTQMDVDERGYIENPPNRPKRTRNKEEFELELAQDAPAVKRPLTFFAEVPEPNKDAAPSNDRAAGTYKKR